MSDPIPLTDEQDELMRSMIATIEDRASDDVSRNLAMRDLERFCERHGRPMPPLMVLT